MFSWEQVYFPADFRGLSHVIVGTGLFSCWFPKSITCSHGNRSISMLISEVYHMFSWEQVYFPADFRSLLHVLIGTGLFPCWFQKSITCSHGNRFISLLISEVYYMFSWEQVYFPADFRSSFLSVFTIICSGDKLQSAGVRADGCIRWEDSYSTHHISKSHGA